MYLSRHQSAAGPRWALEGLYAHAGLHAGASARDAWRGCPASWRIWVPKDRPKTRSCHRLSRHTRGLGQRGDLLGGGRELESTDADALARRSVTPCGELFFKAWGGGSWDTGQRARPRRQPLNVPEPELVLVVNSGMEIVGYTAGNDVSSRNIEGEHTVSPAGQGLRRHIPALWGQV